MFPEVKSQMVKIVIEWAWDIKGLSDYNTKNIPINVNKWNNPKQHKNKF